MYVITAHQRHGQTDGRTSSDPMTATLLKHVAVKTAIGLCQYFRHTDKSRKENFQTFDVQ